MMLPTQGVEDSIAEIPLEFKIVLTSRRQKDGMTYGVHSAHIIYSTLASGSSEPTDGGGCLNNLTDSIM